MSEERQLIRNPLQASNKKSYGTISTNNHYRVLSPEEYITHYVSSTDTLEGIALKYGVTTEQIRRANKLWTNDRLYLRELLIPVESRSLPCTSKPSFDSPTETDLFVNQSLSDIQNGFQKFEYPLNIRSEEELNNIDVLLNRIDSDIANKARQVKKIQDKSFVTPDFTTSIVRRKPAMSRLKQQQQISYNLGTENNNYNEVTTLSTFNKKVQITHSDVSSSSINNNNNEAKVTLEL